MTNLQINRLTAAATEVLEEVGYAQMTVGLVIARARVSRKTFYDAFVNREDCFLAVLEQAIERAVQLAADAYAQQTNWRKSMRAALETILLHMEEESGLARVCVIETLGGGPRILRFRSELLRELARAVDDGRDEPAARRDLPTITAEAVVGGILSVLQSNLHEGHESLADLLGPFMSVMTLPYLGARVAARELSKPAGRPARKKDARMSPTDPLQDLSIRLTYRTVRTLGAIADRPGASNRDIARAAGIADQGQISKLLNRLSKLGLIENEGLGQPKGLSNAWRLTDRGEALRRAVWPRLHQDALEF
ncbi:MAG TPA: TetR family transcriptional regulator [Solirubrobacteraceae bacterium]|nr:TetR family transcriptional regulator [Solirubrobacteraceae bacterium]